MFGGKIRRGQRWLQQELDDGGREVLVHLAKGGLYNPDLLVEYAYLARDFGRLRALFEWAPQQPETTPEELASTIEWLPAISPRQRKVLLREVATVHSRSGPIS